MSKRLSDIAHLRITTLGSKSMAKKAIKRGEVFINGVKGYSGDYIEPSDTITYQPKAKYYPILELTIPVVYEDDYLAIVNKPAGLSVSGNQHRQLDKALPYTLQASTVDDALVRPLPVHRLDKATRGLVLIAKTYRAQQQLSRMLQHKTITKRYEAIIIGPLEGRGSIITAVGNKAALSEYSVIETYPSQRYGQLAHVHLYPITGRTHQLRIHLAQAGYPIMGDRLYCPPHLLRSRGLRLAATSITMNHPITNAPISVAIDFTLGVGK